MTAIENSPELDEQAIEDAARLKRFKVLYPLYQLLSAMSKAFSTYVTYFYTNVYNFSVNFTAVITLTSSIISWVGTPVFAAFIDGFSFKNAKYWPWILVGSFITQCGTILIICLRAITGKTVELMYLVFVIRILMTLIAPMSSTPMSGCFPKLSKDPRERQYFGMAQKVGRDGGKTIWGYIVPAILMALSGGGEDPTMTGYALTAIICYGAHIAAIWLFALVGLRGSYVEREGLKETSAKKKNKVPLSAMVKCIFGNRAVLGMFLYWGLHKSYYYIYTSYATYVFRYVYQDLGKIGTFMTVFNLLAIIGVMFGPLWSKIFKDSKRSLIAAMASHVILQVLIFLTFGNHNFLLYLVLFGASSFFMGMLENWTLPNFAAAADYGAWRTGARMDSLVMACYNLSMNVSRLLTTLVATTFLNSFDYTNWLKAYKDGTVGITSEVTNGLTNLFTLAPAVIAAVSLVCLVFIYNINDDRLAKIHADLDAGKTMATSEYRF